MINPYTCVLVCQEDYRRVFFDDAEDQELSQINVGDAADVDMSSLHGSETTNDRMVNLILKTNPALSYRLNEAIQEQ